MKNFMILWVRSFEIYFWIRSAWNDFFIPLDLTILMKSFKYENCFLTDLFVETDVFQIGWIKVCFLIEYKDSIETIR